MKNLSTPHRTAIERKKVSAPMKFLEDEGHLEGRVLDYGCGRGFDAGALGLESYDPYFFPEVPKGKFDTITCNYVLNVVDEETEAYLIPDQQFLDLCARYKSFYAYFLENFSQHITDSALDTIITSGQAKLFLTGVAPFSFLDDMQDLHLLFNRLCERYPLF